MKPTRQILQPASAAVTAVVPFGAANPEKYLAARESARTYLLSKGFPEGTFVEIPVKWADLDSNQHVNNKVYALWCETGRVHYFSHLMASIPPALAARISGIGNGMGLILARVSIVYIKPTFAPDTVVVAHKLKDIEPGKLVIESAIYSYGQLSQVSKGEAKMALFDYEQQKAATWPKDIRDAFEKHVNTSGKL